MICCRTTPEELVHILLEAGCPHCSEEKGDLRCERRRYGHGDSQYADYTNGVDNIVETTG
jgi:hypothetical protein